MSETYPHCEHCDPADVYHQNVNHTKPCRFDDCEGAQPIEAQPVALVLAEVLAAINTYDPLIFTDQHRALFERAEAARQATSGTGAGEVAQQLWEEGRHLPSLYAAKGYAAELAAWKDWLKRCADFLLTVPAQRRTDEDRKLECPAPPCQNSYVGPDAERELVRHYFGAHPAAAESIGMMAVAERAIAAAPGVAELLAECARRQREWPDCPVMNCDEIVRMLAPERADDEGEGT